MSVKEPICSLENKCLLLFVMWWHSVWVCTRTNSLSETKLERKKKNLRDGVLLPSASHSAESAFLCLSPLSSSLPSLSLSVAFSLQPKHFYSLFLSFHHVSSWFPLLAPPPSSASSLHPLLCPAKGLADRMNGGQSQSHRASVIHSLRPTPHPLPRSLSQPSSSLLLWLPRLGSLHFSMRWDGEHSQRAHCSPTKPGGEQQKGLTRPRESRGLWGDPLCHHLRTLWKDRELDCLCAGWGVQQRWSLLLFELIFLEL